ncbi:MAG: translocation/assembly module TamB [Bacteroidetes bacterium]|nr:translocation/assembly module TamB [Bacteroidota bacterium]
MRKGIITYIKLTLKIVLVTILTLILILLIGTLVFQFPNVQNYVANAAVHKIEEKTGVHVTVDKIAVSLYGRVNIKGFFAQDNKEDTLLFAESLKVKVSLLKILNKTIQVNKVRLENAQIRLVMQDEDSTMNFSPYLKAFKKPKDSKVKSPKGKKDKFAVVLKKVQLKNVRFFYKSIPDQNSIRVNTGDFDVKLNRTDLDKKIIDIKSMSFNETVIDMLVNNKKYTNEASPFSWDVTLERDLSLTHVNFKLKDNFSAQKLEFKNINLNVTARKLDLKNNNIQLGDLELLNSRFYVQKNLMSSEDSARVEALKVLQAKNQFDWTIRARKVKLKNNSFGFNKENQTERVGQINFADLQFNRVSGLFESLELYKYHLSFRLKDFSLSEKSGFQLNQLAATLDFNSNGTVIQNLLLETPYSKISQNVLLQYNSVEKLQKDISHVSFKLRMDSSWIGVPDLHYFLPREMDTIRYISAIKHRIYIASHIAAQQDTLRINLLKANYDSTFMSLSGYVNNYKQFSDNTFAEIEVKDFKTTRKDINAFLPDSMLPDKMVLPSKINLVTRFKGTKNIFNTSTQIRSNYGEMLVKVQTNKSKGNRRSFNSEVSLKDFDLGQLISNNTLGHITQRTEVSGTIPLKEYTDVIADININVSNISLLDYEYKNISLTGALTREEINTNINYSDSNLIFSLSGLMNRKDSVPAYDLNLNLKGADLQALKLTNTNLRTRGKFKAKISGSTINNSNGEIVLSDLILFKDDQIFDVDSVHASLTNTKHASKISLESPFLKVNYFGTIKPQQVYPIVKQYFRKYVPWSADTTINIQDKGQFDFSLELTQSDMLTEALIPGLKSMLPVSAKASYDSKRNAFEVLIDMPAMEYNNFSIEDFIFNLNESDSTQLIYNLNFARISADPLVIGKTEFYGNANDDSIKLELKIPGESNKTKYSLGVFLTEANKCPKMEFIPGGFILNYTKYYSPEKSYVIFKPEQLELNNVRFYSEDQSLQIKNDTVQKEEYLFELSNFSINNLTEIIETESELIEGILNGKVSVGNQEENKLFNADLIMHDVFISKYRVFNTISLKANNVQENRIEVYTKFLGDNDELELNGFLSREKDESHLDFDMQIKQLNLDYFRDFTSELFDTLSGFVHGDIKLQGNLKSPQLQAEVSVDDVKIKPDYLNTTFYIDDEKINVNNNTVLFSRFALKDYQNNVTYINGAVDFKDIGKPEFDLSVDSKNFRFLNTDYQDGRLYYGKVNANLQADITGNPAQPNVDLTVNLGDDSEFHFVIPELNNASVEEEGIVRFVDKKDTLWTGIFDRTTEVQDSLKTLRGKGINLSANIEIESGMDIYIEIDPASNEELFINGNANLSFRKRRAETPTLNGRFEIADGTYTLTLYELIRRTFTIQEGSYLMWNGNIQNPVTNITTTYQVRTSPVPLISNETAGFSAENTSKYSNNTPFLVNLNIEGNMLKPNLNFNLSTPAGQADAIVQAKLVQLNQNESQLHKQVFSLLLFNSFIESTSASNKTSTYELNATARTSVSKLLTRQISSFADRYIKYVDLDVGVNSYYNRVGDQASGQTEVSLDVSKRLLNDHLTVKLGGDFNVENRSSERQNQNLSNIAGDVIIEYRIDDDGTYRIQGFNKTEYDDFFDGEVNKTGAAFIFNKDFYKLNQLFKSDTTKSKKEDQ